MTEQETEAAAEACTPFEISCEMEDDLDELRALAMALDLMAMGMSTDEKDEDSVPIGHIARRMKRLVEAVEERRGQLFEMLNPRRHELEGAE
jgi:hypothetical protein